MAKNLKGAKLPKGFKPISGLGGTWDHKNEPVLQGNIVKFGETPSKYHKGEMQKFCVIKRKDGSEATVWESAGTRSLFDVKKGKAVAVAFLGMKKIPGRKQPMKDFQVGVM